MTTILVFLGVSAFAWAQNAQLSLPVSPLQGNPVDLTLSVNPGLSALFTVYLRIGTCRMQLHGDTVFVYEGGSMIESHGDIGDGGVVQSGQCKVDLGASRRFATGYRLRVELTTTKADTSTAIALPIVAEYSWVKAPYVFYTDTLGDWVVPAAAQVKGPGQ